MNDLQNTTDASLLLRTSLGDNPYEVDLTNPHGYESYHVLKCDGKPEDDVTSAVRRVSSFDSRRDSTVSSYAEKEEPARPQFHERETPSIWARISSNTWIFEFFALLFSLACTFGMIAVLYAFNGKVINATPGPLPLNTIVSVLAICAQASLMAVFASILSQLKWDWFRQRRQLSELHIFDSASRGAIGSMRMLLKGLGNRIAITGAVLTILALVFEPFVQQVVRYSSMTRPSSQGTASIRTTSEFHPQIDGINLISAINAGIWADGAQFSNEPTCTSGDCEWPDFESLGWCSVCEDATAHAMFSPSCDTISSDQETAACTLSLGSGTEATVAYWTRNSPALSPALSEPVVALVSEVIWPLYSVQSPNRKGSEGLNSTYPRRTRRNASLNIDYPALILGYAKIESESMDQQDVIDFQLRLAKAEQCVLTPCVRKHRMRVSSGNVQTDTVSTDYGTIVHPLLSPSGAAPSLLSCWQSDPSPVTYSYAGDERNTTGSGQYWTNKTLSAFCPVAEYAEKIASYFNSSAGPSSYYYAGPKKWLPASSVASKSSTLYRVAGRGLHHVIDSIAASLTSLAIAEANTTITGTSHVEITTIYIDVHWGWLIYPVLLEVAGVVIFVLTIIRTRSRKTLLWKSSLLPLLFGGLQSEFPRDDPAPVDIAGMESRARKMQVSLNSDQYFHALCEE